MVITWEQYFMGLAQLSSLRSKDPNTQVGACIVDTKSNRILSVGYNGFPMGCSDKEFPWEKGNPDDYDNKYSYVVHAEANAILNSGGRSLEGATLYVTMSPCRECTKLIIQAGIKNVVYLEQYGKDDRISDRMFNAAGVTRRKMPASIRMNFGKNTDKKPEVVEPKKEEPKHTKSGRFMDSDDWYWIEKTPLKLPLYDYDVYGKLTNAPEADRTNLAMAIYIMEATVQGIKYVFDEPVTARLDFDNSWVGGRLLKLARDRNGETVEIDDYLTGYVDYEKKIVSVAALNGTVESIVFSGFICDKESAEIKQYYEQIEADLEKKLRDKNNEDRLPYRTNFGVLNYEYRNYMQDRARREAAGGYWKSCLLNSSPINLPIKDLDIVKDLVQDEIPDKNKYKIVPDIRISRAVVNGGIYHFNHATVTADGSGNIVGGRMLGIIKNKNDEKIEVNDRIIGTIDYDTGKINVRSENNTVSSVCFLGTINIWIPLAKKE